EEAAMRRLFLELEVRAANKGMHGRFALRLTVEASEAPTAEIVARSISQRLAPHPERYLQYPWGSVAYHDLPRRLAMPAPTRLYSPNMLMGAFAWNCDLPDWDGIVCRVAGDGQSPVDEIRNPIALVWSNSSAGAI